MKIHNLTNKQYKDKKKLRIYEGVSNQEADLYTVVISSITKVLKIFRKDQNLKYDEYFLDKVNTLTILEMLKESLNIEEFVYPEKITAIKDELCSYIMEFANGVCLQEMFDNNKIDVKLKIEVLSKIGELLSRLKVIREKLDVDIFLNDIHEGNIMVDVEESDVKIKIIDLDSCKLKIKSSDLQKIKENHPITAKYLLYYCTGLSKAPNKYIAKVNPYVAQYEANEQSDLYCYTMMIINLLYGSSDFYKLDLVEQYDYFEYLNEIGINKDLLTIFENMYTAKENENPYDKLESLSEIYYRANRKVYEAVTKK